MKRREFLKNTAIIGSAASMVSPKVTIGNNQNKKNEIIYFDGNEQQVTTLLILENELLKVSVKNNASVQIIDKVNNKEWEMGKVALQEYGQIEEGHVWLMNERSMCQQYPGRFFGKKLNDSLIEFTLIGKQNRVRGKFNCEISLDKQWLKYKIYSISDEIQSLVFPPPIKSDATVIPNGIGKINRDTEKGGIFSRYIKTFFTHLNMRWIGGLHNNYGWICVYDEGYEDAFSLEANRTVSPGYMRTLGEWKHPYSVKFMFLKGSYVQLAKAYRKYFQEKGEFKSIDEKIKENPTLDNFRGGRGFWTTLASGVQRDRDMEDFLFSEHQIFDKKKNGKPRIRFTYKEVKELIKKYESLGMKKGFIKIAGWINKGYDWSHPDIWPPEPKLGEISELKELMEWKGNIVTGLHDNYMDMYEGVESFPNGIVHQKDGSLMTGGFWGGGQAYIMHYANSIEYAKRNWEKIKTLNPKAMFCDTATAMQLYQSFEEGKRLTKADDAKAKLEFMKFFKKQNQLFGSEEAADFSIPYVDWFETRFKRDSENYIPLWLLAFHDAAFIMRYGSSGVGGNYPKWLEDMLWGTNLHFSSHSNFDEEYFKSTFAVDRWNEKVGTAEMLDHKFLTEDKMVEQTEFSSGHAIIVNFSDEVREVEGKIIEAKAYKILS